jgi:hypothetical protein
VVGAAEKENCGMLEEEPRWSQGVWLKTWLLIWIKDAEQKERVLLSI